MELHRFVEEVMDAPPIDSFGQETATSDANAGPVPGPGMDVDAGDLGMNVDLGDLGMGMDVDVDVDAADPHLGMHAEQGAGSGVPLRWLGDGCDSPGNGSVHQLDLDFYVDNVEEAKDPPMLAAPGVDDVFSAAERPGHLGWDTAFADATNLECAAAAFADATNLEYAAAPQPQPVRTYAASSWYSHLHKGWVLLRIADHVGGDQMRRTLHTHLPGGVVQSVDVHSDIIRHLPGLDLHESNVRDRVRALRLWPVFRLIPEGGSEKASGTIRHVLLQAPTADGGVALYDLRSGVQHEATDPGAMFDGKKRTTARTRGDEMYGPLLKPVKVYVRYPLELNLGFATPPENVDYISGDAMKDERAKSANLGKEKWTAGDRLDAQRFTRGKNTKEVTSLRGHAVQLATEPGVCMELGFAIADKGHQFHVLRWRSSAYLSEQPGAHRGDDGKQSDQLGPSRHRQMPAFVTSMIPAKSFTPHRVWGFEWGCVASLVLLDETDATETTQGALLIVTAYGHTLVDTTALRGSEVHEVLAVFPEGGRAPADGAPHLASDAPTLRCVTANETFLLRNGRTRAVTKLEEFLCSEDPLEQLRRDRGELRFTVPLLLGHEDVARVTYLEDDLQDVRAEVRCIPFENGVMLEGHGRFGVLLQDEATRREADLTTIRLQSLLALRLGDRCRTPVWVHGPSEGTGLAELCIHHADYRVQCIDGTARRMVKAGNTSVFNFTRVTGRNFGQDRVINPEKRWMPYKCLLYAKHVAVKNMHTTLVRNATLDETQAEILRVAETHIDNVIDTLVRQDADLIYAPSSRLKRDRTEKELAYVAGVTAQPAGDITVDTTNLATPVYTARDTVNLVEGDVSSRKLSGCEKEVWGTYGLLPWCSAARYPVKFVPLPRQQQQEAERKLPLGTEGLFTVCESAGYDGEALQHCVQSAPLDAAGVTAPLMLLRAHLQQSGSSLMHTANEAAQRDPPTLSVWAGTAPGWDTQLADTMALACFLTLCTHSARFTATWMAATLTLADRMLRDQQDSGRAESQRSIPGPREGPLQPALDWRAVEQQPLWQRVVYAAFTRSLFRVWQTILRDDRVRAAVQRVYDAGPEPWSNDESLLQLGAHFVHDSGLRPRAMLHLLQKHVSVRPSACAYSYLHGNMDLTAARRRVRVPWPQPSGRSVTRVFADLACTLDEVVGHTFLGEPSMAEATDLQRMLGLQDRNAALHAARAGLTACREQGRATERFAALRARPRDMERLRDAVARLTVPAEFSAYASDIPALLYLLWPYTTLSTEWPWELLHPLPVPDLGATEGPSRAVYLPSQEQIDVYLVARAVLRHMSTRDHPAPPDREIFQWLCRDHRSKCLDMPGVEAVADPPDPRAFFVLRKMPRTDPTSLRIKAGAVAQMLADLPRCCTGAQACEFAPPPHTGSAYRLMPGVPRTGTRFMMRTELGPPLYKTMLGYAVNKNSKSAPAWHPLLAQYTKSKNRFERPQQSFIVGAGAAEEKAAFELVHDFMRRRHESISRVVSDIETRYNAAASRRAHAHNQRAKRTSRAGKKRSLHHRSGSGGAAGPASQRVRVSPQLEPPESKEIPQPPGNLLNGRFLGDRFAAPPVSRQQYVQSYQSMLDAVMPKVRRWVLSAQWTNEVTRGALRKELERYFPELKATW